MADNIGPQRVAPKSLTAVQAEAKQTQDYVPALLSNESIMSRAQLDKYRARLGQIQDADRYAFIKQMYARLSNEGHYLNSPLFGRRDQTFDEAIDEAMRK